MSGWARNRDEHALAWLPATENSHPEALELTMDRRLLLRASGSVLVATGALAQTAKAQCVEGKLLASDGQAGDLFGRSVSMSGDLIVVGAAEAGPSGAVYAFERTGDAWSESAKLVASDGQVGDAFGWSVDVFEGTCVVGAVEPGKAYVYEKTGSTWVESADLIPASSGLGIEFGISVAIGRDTIAVGASSADGTESGAGAVFVYERNGAEWRESARLTAPDGASGDAFGAAVATSGGVVLIGARGDDDVGTSSGSAYVFERTQFGWVLMSKLIADDGVSGDSFGWSVALDASTAVVGAYGHDALGESAGAVYVYESSGVDWPMSSKLLAIDGDEGDAFGRAVAVSGNRILVGASRDEHAGQGAGSAYVFQRTDTGWNQSVKVGAADRAPGDRFGEALALGNNGAIIGAYFDDDLGLQAGAAYALEDEQFVPAFSDPYCFCSMDAPCSNPYANGGCKNFTREGAFLSICGSSSIADDDLTLTVSGMPTNQFGLIYMGGGEHDAIAFGAGQRCVGAGASSIHRFPVRFTGASGQFSEGPGIVSYSQDSFGVSGGIDAGETWYFQGWYRDPLGPCATFNTSNAAAILFGM